MAKREIDGVIKDWGERADYGRVQGRKGKNIAGGRYSKAAPTKRPAGREKLAATVRKAPEVMVKISGGGKDMRSIKAHMDYISRNGEVELEDEQGRIHLGKEDVRDVRDDWRGGGIPYEDGKKREAFNIVLSMPPGTDRKSVTDAAREFAKSEFGGNFHYVFATHDDEKHPHVHLCVNAQGIDGTRLNPRKTDLQRWREGFAEALREHGIEANATPRLLRNARRRTRRQPALHANASQRRGESPEHTSKAVPKVINGYAALAKALAQGDQEDRQLATGIVETVRSMVAPNRSEPTGPAMKPRGPASDAPQVAPVPANKNPSHER